MRGAKSNGTHSVLELAAWKEIDDGRLEENVGHHRNLDFRRGHILRAQKGNG